MFLLLYLRRRPRAVVPCQQSIRYRVECEQLFRSLHDDKVPQFRWPPPPVPAETDEPVTTAKVQLADHPVAVIQPCQELVPRSDGEPFATEGVLTVNDAALELCIAHFDELFHQYLVWVIDNHFIYLRHTRATSI